MQTEVRKNTEKSRYELILGSEVVGVAEFIDAHPEYQDLLAA